MNATIIQENGTALTSKYLQLTGGPLTGNLNTDNSVTLDWLLKTSVCTPVSNWNIFNNDILIQNIAFPTSSTIIDDLIPGNTYSFYVVAVNNDMRSQPSNIYTITIPT